MYVLMPAPHSRRSRSKPIGLPSAATASDSGVSKQNLVNQSGLAYFPPQRSNHSSAARCLPCASGLAYVRDAPASGHVMVKATKFFRKQAVKAERMARSVSDAEISQSFLSMAKAYRSQADVLKAEKLKAKKLKARKLKAKKLKAKKKSGKKRH
jgi:hypothetical protein